MAKIIDGASGQNNIEVKLKHRRARCLLYYIQGDTSKLAQPNDQSPNKAVVDFIRRGSARYNCPSPKFSPYFVVEISCSHSEKTSC